MPENKNNNMIAVDFNDTFQLVADINDWDPEAKNLAEICIYLKNKKTGEIYQDIALISRNYKTNNDGTRELFDEVSVKVWSDSNNEDFTVEYLIPPYEYED